MWNSAKHFVFTSRTSDRDSFDALRDLTRPRLAQVTEAWRKLGPYREAILPNGDPFTWKFFFSDIKIAL
jgi:hypothetical protein